MSSELLPPSLLNPINKNKINVIEKEGIVVYIIYLMWVIRSVPAMAGARLVVSLNGDILSPK